MNRLHERDLRGHTKTGWLDSRHTFSFGGFSDPSRMGFRSLRVINEDHVIPGAGFGSHKHADMEIITYVIDGALRHEDSLGNGSIIKPGEIQRMSAGSGITHSEMNASQTDPVHFLQIWVLPKERGTAPGYKQTALPAPEDGWQLLASPDESQPGVTIGQDMTLHRLALSDGQTAQRPIPAGHGGFIQVVDGIAKIGDERLVAGDGLEFEGPADWPIEAVSDIELLFFDLK
ncbi:MAG: pirin family protein [Alphaproteobacteria bacterium]|nr:pirin family protein [Alphaproteobacteria bacterium SS10]